MPLGYDNSGTGGNGVGGLMGANSNGTVSNCYSNGPVRGAGRNGGLMAYNQGVVIHCFWEIQTSGQPRSAGGIGKTAAEMKMVSTFLAAGWDFVNVWGIGENQTYPYLRKYSAADINQDATVNFLDLAVLAENWLTGTAP